MAAEVLGVEIVRIKPFREAESQSVGCRKGSEPSSDPSKIFYVNVYVFTGSGDAFRGQAASQKGTQPVAGLGDLAYFVPDAGTLFIADGNDGASVQVVKGGEPGAQEDCVTVAKEILSKRG